MISILVFLHRNYKITIVSPFLYDICHVDLLNKSKNKPESFYDSGSDDIDN